jgi:aspartokinase/homoserine dehydrogenase 1
MARFGATVLFSKTIAPVRPASIPIVVRNTFDPGGAATWVGSQIEIPSGARSLASVERAAVLKVRPPNGHANAAGAMASASSRCLIAATATDMEWTLVAAEEDARILVGELVGTGHEVELFDNASVVSVVGSRLLRQPWVAGRSLEALGRRQVELKGILSPSDHAFCVVVDRAEHERALAILHEALMLSHLAGKAADAARRAALSKGGHHDSPPAVLRGRDRRDRNRGSAARSPAA